MASALRLCSAERLIRDLGARNTRSLFALLPGFCSNPENLDKGKRHDKPSQDQAKVCSVENVFSVTGVTPRVPTLARYWLQVKQRKCAARPPRNVGSCAALKTC